MRERVRRALTSPTPEELDRRIIKLEDDLERLRQVFENDHPILAKLGPPKIGRYRRQTLKPPISASFLLSLLLKRSDRLTILGDLEEEFATTILPTYGRRRASIWYWFQVVRTIGYRNLFCRWLLIGGGVFKIGEWISRKIGG
jgi:hypothetical protein